MNEKKKSSNNEVKNKSRQAADIKELKKLIARKKTFLNAEMKSCSYSFTIRGMKYAIEDAQGNEDKERRFREKALLVLVDQKLLKAESVFVGGVVGEEGRRLIPGIVHHVRPLGPRDNGPVVVSFVGTSSLASAISRKLTQSPQFTGGIRVVAHVPPIIDALRGQALKERSRMLKADPTRRIVVNKSFEIPWIRLSEIFRDGQTVPLPFPVDDDRLVHPALTLVRLEIAGNDTFVPKAALKSPQERASISPGIVRARNYDDDDDDDNDDGGTFIECLAELAARRIELEALKEERFKSLVEQKRYLLNAQVKSLAHSFLINGMKYAIADARGDAEKEERFRETALSVLVDQKLVSREKLFVRGDGPSNASSVIRPGILIHAHPVEDHDDAAVSVAFIDKTFAGPIAFKLNQQNAKNKKSKIHITQQLPPILTALRSEALKARRAMLTADPKRKITLRKYSEAPWIRLLEEKSGQKAPIDFLIGDQRLLDPAATLAKLEIEGRGEFVPKVYLTAKERVHLGAGAVKAANERGCDGDFVNGSADVELPENSPRNMSRKKKRQERERLKPDLAELVTRKRIFLCEEMQSSMNQFSVSAGVRYDPKKVREDEDEQKRFHERIMRRFVDYGLLDAKSVFAAGVDGAIRPGVLLHARPVNSQKNATVVVTLDSSLANRINANPAFSRNRKWFNGRKQLCISRKVPPVILALQNAALAARRDMIKVDPKRRIIMTKSTREPWVQLMEITGKKKVILDFPVVDDRLVDPALTLAKLEMEGKHTFVPLSGLSKEKRADIRPGVVKAYSRRLPEPEKAKKDADDVGAGVEDVGAGVEDIGAGADDVGDDVQVDVDSDADANVGGAAEARTHIEGDAEAGDSTIEDDVGANAGADASDDAVVDGDVDKDVDTEVGVDDNANYHGDADSIIDGGGDDGRDVDENVGSDVLGVDSDIDGTMLSGKSLLFCNKRSLRYSY